MTAPALLDNARVVCFASIGEDQRHTGLTRHFILGKLQSPAKRLAICRYDDDPDGGVYLFGCDAGWNVITDTWHESVDAAKRQAADEYEGIECAWISPGNNAISSDE